MMPDTAMSCSEGQGEGQGASAGADQAGRATPRAATASRPFGDHPSREELALFVRESNWIEGIRRDPTDAEIDAHRAFLAKSSVSIEDMIAFVGVVQPNARLRDAYGLNVYVGDHVPPPGGVAIAYALDDILSRATDAYRTHVEYETLHPFTDGNGRSGRVLWLKMMGGDAPLGFLHHWYYQSLSNSGFRGKADTLALRDSDRHPQGGNAVPSRSDESAAIAQTPSGEP